MIIYKITNLVNNKIYIGQTIKTAAQRFANHKYDLRKNQHHSKYLQRSWNKYGEEKFLFEIIEIITTLEELDNREIFWIAFYNTTNPQNGYNAQGGGQFNRIITNETRKKISKSLIGNNRSLGKKQNLTIEQRKIKSQTSTKFNIGRKYSDKTKKKIGDAFRGKKSIFWGKPGINRKKVKCLNNNRIYESIMAASIDLACCRKTITAICKGLKIHTKGYQFIYIE